MKKVIICIFIMVLFVLFGLKSSKVHADAVDYVLYGDTIQSGWVNWSWNSSINTSYTSDKYTGSSAIQFSPNGWGAFYLHSESPLNTNGYSSINFAIKSSSPDQKFAILLYDSSNNPINGAQSLKDLGGQPVANMWQNYSIPLSQLHADNTTIKGFALQEITGNNQSNIVIDDIKFHGVSQNTSNPSIIYEDSLTSGWNDWSWNSSVNFYDTTTKYSGNSSISYKPNSPWAALYLHSDTAINTSSFSSLTFAVRATDVNEKFGIFLFDDQNHSLSNAVDLSTYTAPSQYNWVQYTIPLAVLNATNKGVKGIVIQEMKGSAQSQISVDSIKFTLDTVTPMPSPSSTDSPTSTPTVTPTPSTVPTEGFSTNNNTIYKNGQPIKLQGVNWSGFESSSHTVKGLQQRNYKDIIKQIKTLGFNAVRIPFCPSTVYGTTVSGIDYSKNPDLSGLNSQGVLDKVINEMNAEGLYFMLDFHNIDCNSSSELWYMSWYPEVYWQNDLAFVANRYKNENNFVGIDLKNEPHGQATWGNQNSATDWNKAAEKAGAAVLAANPNLLIFVEGVQENPSCAGSASHWWGGNIEPISCFPIANISIPANKLVLAPHTYGPDVYMQSYFSDSSFPLNMSTVWDAQVGAVVAKGYTVTIGEWGGKYGNGGTQLDTTWQDSFVKYLIAKRICNTFYWSLNPESSDTGGILQNDWTTPWQNKVTLLNNYFNSCTQ